MSSTNLAGELRGLLSLFFPILMMTFSSGAYLLIEKLFLSRVSLVSMEVGVTLAYIAQIFQVACTPLAMMAHVSVARWAGAKKWEKIGPVIWQFIWFSIFSIFLVVPIGLIYGNIYLKGTAFKEIAMPILSLLLGINFLFPLGMALSSFYIARGKTRLILFVTIGSQILKTILAYVLILGSGSWIPPMGLLGGVLSTFLAQAGLCLILLAVFLNRENAIIYKSRSWKFDIKLFWDNIRPGLLRTINRILNVTCWASITHLMAIKGELYLVVLSVGGALFLFLPFLGDAICQSMTIIVSQMLGAKEYLRLPFALRAGFIWAIACSIPISIPFLAFPIQTFHLLFPEILIEPNVIRLVFLGVWASFTCFTLGFVPISYVLAFKDMGFSAFMGAFNWINGYLLMYIAIEKLNIGAEYFWLVLTIMHGSVALLYLWRAFKLSSRVLSKQESVVISTTS